MPVGGYCRNKILVMRQTTELCSLDYFAAFDFKSLDQRLCVCVY